MSQEFIRFALEGVKTLYEHRNDTNEGKPETMQVTVKVYRSEQGKFRVAMYDPGDVVFIMHDCPQTEERTFHWKRTFLDDKYLSLDAFHVGRFETLIPGAISIGCIHADEGDLLYQTKVKVTLTNPWKEETLLKTALELVA